MIQWSPEERQASLHTELPNSEVGMYGDVSFHVYSIL